MTTFVTSFIKLDEERSGCKTVDKYFELFDKLAKSGINIVLYLDKRLSLKNKYENVKVEEISLEDLWTYQHTFSNSSIPKHRNETKDTKNYMIIINSKLDILEKAINLNPFKTDNFAWIDFGIFHVFKDEKRAVNRLKNLNNFNKDSLIFPGGKYPPTNSDIIWDGVYWRFLGGFFIGPRYKLLKFIEEYKKFYVEECQKKNRITWEVNIWAKLESIIKPTIYVANHDNSMLEF